MIKRGCFSRARCWSVSVLVRRSRERNCISVISPSVAPAAESVPGPPGDSAYEVAVKNGFDGTETEWLDSLQGEPGEKGADSIVLGQKGDAFTYDDFTAEELEELKGEPGEKGADSKSLVRKVTRLRTTTSHQSSWRA